MTGVQENIFRQEYRRTGFRQEYKRTNLYKITRELFFIKTQKVLLYSCIHVKKIALYSCTHVKKSTSVLLYSCQKVLLAGIVLLSNNCAG